MFKIITGDLIKMAKNNEFDIIAHGCNCFHMMGAGIAKTIREEFPEAYEADLKTAAESYNKLGTISIAKSSNGVYIVNAYTQFTPGADARYNALSVCLEKIFYFSNKWKLKRLGLPLIGCGIGGLDEEKLRNFVNYYSSLYPEVELTLVKFEE